MKKQIAVIPVKKTNGNRNRNAGHQLERDLVLIMREVGFPHTVTSRVESKRRDDAKVDLMNKDEGENGRLPYNIQAKNLCTGSINHHKLLAEMPRGKEINVIIHNQTKKSDGGRFITQGQFAIMDSTAFFRMAKVIENQKKAFELLNSYFDSIPKEDQVFIHEQLKILGL